MTALIPGRTVVQVAGAGPAGLAAAITLARAGRSAIVHEARAAVGERFQGDLQGLENWTDTEDVLGFLRGLGLTTSFRHVACHSGTAFDAWGQDYAIQSHLPLYYMVERGPGDGTVDSALLRQAVALGVEVRFNSRLERLAGPGVLAAGPRAPDAIAVGYHFESDMADGFWAICDDRIAPRGYAYLLTMAGRGTIKSCMFTDFKHEKIYVARAVQAFERLVGLDMRNPRPHGGVGNLQPPRTALAGMRRLAGEEAGFQDALWGFGMRYALLSGVLAARSLLDGSDYDAAWRKEFGRQLRASLSNRAFYSLIGNRGYRRFLRRQERSGDARGFLHRLYKPSVINQFVFPWAQWRYRRQRRHESCNHIDCECIWCRCGAGG